MPHALLRVLLLSAAVAWPAQGLTARDFSRSLAFAPRMTSLFPEGQVPGPHTQAGAGTHGRGLFSTEEREETRYLRRICQVEGFGPTYRYFDVETPGLDETFVLERPSSRAAVLVVPGGARLYLGWEREGTKTAEWLNSLNISAFVLKYRVPSSESRAAFMDVERAMSMVRSRAPELGIDTDRIGVIGFSAGGALAAWVSGNEIRSYVRIDEIDDVPFKPNFQLLVYADTPEAAGQKLPTTFMAHAEDDPCVPQARTEAYCRAVKQVAHQSCTRFLYPNGGHGVGVCTGTWAPGFPHTPGPRGAVNGMDGWYNTWSGDALCGWFHEAEKWLGHVGVI